MHYFFKNGSIASKTSPAAPHKSLFNGEILLHINKYFYYFILSSNSISQKHDLNVLWFRFIKSKEMELASFESFLFK